MVLTVAAGMKLENHPIISFTFSILISAIAAICSNGNFASCILVTTLTNFCFSPVPLQTLLP